MTDFMSVLGNSDMALLWLWLISPSLKPRSPRSNADALPTMLFVLNVHINKYSPESEYSEETELIENQDNYNLDVHIDMPSNSLESGIKNFDLNLKQFLLPATQ
ncbi:hypothetical protein BB561_006556 [Smittium simulii]|uniref:Uncharacterized protein n=1 Tax=Smittium simulii TaxID=133385 RepID=A0A2T9Y369_9FUNG|nr:hypothetical protein BB561_006556 [Smittium simulii]